MNNQVKFFFCFLLEGNRQKSVYILSVEFDEFFLVLFDFLKKYLIYNGKLKFSFYNEYFCFFILSFYCFVFYKEDEFGF